jgi:hypothetical protein
MWASFLKRAGDQAGCRSARMLWACVLPRCDPPDATPRSSDEDRAAPLSDHARPIAWRSLRKLWSALRNRENWSTRSSRMSGPPDSVPDRQLLYPERGATGGLRRNWVVARIRWTGARSQGAQRPQPIPDPVSCRHINPPPHWLVSPQMAAVQQGTQIRLESQMVPGGQSAFDEQS